MLTLIRLRTTQAKPLKLEILDVYSLKNELNQFTICPYGVIVNFCIILFLLSFICVFF